MNGCFHTLIRNPTEWEAYLTYMAEACEGNRGEPEEPERYPFLVMTSTQYYGSVSAGADDYGVRHWFVYATEARLLLREAYDQEGPA